MRSGACTRRNSYVGVNPIVCWYSHALEVNCRPTWRQAISHGTSAGQLCLDDSSEREPVTAPFSSSRLAGPGFPQAGAFFLQEPVCAGFYQRRPALPPPAGCTGMVAL
jgi:hypothetical protein